ncbi:MAG TPA: hypothetical protein VN461_23295 [Vicinamibacteria bacterium]|nr:hypothetical protein [Vicinamibacteria bacterium]
MERAPWSDGVEMAFRSTPLDRLTTVALGLTFLISFVLPCLCPAEAKAGHLHCEGSEGPAVADSSCCCGGALPVAAEATAKLVPTTPGAPSAVVALPLSFPTLSRIAAVPAGRPPDGPRALLVLRI